MDLSRRFRAFFLFAAVLLCLSVCFVYAQDTAPAANTHPAAAPALGAQPAMWVGPTHSSFLRPLSETRLTADPALLSHAAPIASAAVLSAVEAASHTHHRLLHIGRARTRRDAQHRPMQESAILETLSHAQSARMQ